MEFFHAALEANALGATIYITGFLTDDAASRAAELMVGLSAGTRVVRLDLRAVELIDPRAFVSMARTLTRWRDARRGRVTIEFPRPSANRRRAPLRLVDQQAMTPTAVSTAMS
ncbi:MAG TPA: hypothetical protein VHV78_01025 [Gemmatimonadaceae bacterium]|jgi:ABC-type transporter Mla MlaB component|nr:hypothetical protein [Gemmatimonadaceae bacterium]